VGSPEYFQQHPRPRKPSNLAGHRAVNLTLPITGATSTWRLMKNGQEISVRLEGSLTFNTIDLIIEAALCGWGIAHVPLDQVVQHLQSGRLMQVLKSWTPSLPAYHLYYSRRRHLSLAFNLFLDAVRVPPKEDDDDQNTPPRARS
jgi:DNA-binding transcriptional LysR family regulator